MAPSRHDWKIVYWDVKPQHNQPTFIRKLLLNEIEDVFLKTTLIRIDYINEISSALLLRVTRLYGTVMAVNMF